MDISIPTALKSFSSAGAAIKDLTNEFKTGTTIQTHAVGQNCSLPSDLNWPLHALSHSVNNFMSKAVVSFCLSVLSGILTHHMEFSFSNIGTGF